MAAGTFEGGDTPRINVEFTEDISTANSDDTKIVNSLVAKKYVSGGNDTVIDIFKELNGSRDATAIDINGNRLSVELDAAKLAQYEDDSIYLEYDDALVLPVLEPSLYSEEQGSHHQNAVCTSTQRLIDNSSRRWELLQQINCNCGFVDYIRAGDLRFDASDAAYTSLGSGGSERDIETNSMFVTNNTVTTDFVINITGTDGDPTASFTTNENGFVENQEVRLTLKFSGRCEISFWQIFTAGLTTSASAVDANMLI